MSNDASEFACSLAIPLLILRLFCRDDGGAKLSLEHRPP